MRQRKEDLQRVEWREETSQSKVKKKQILAARERHRQKLLQRKQHVAEEEAEAQLKMHFEVLAYVLIRRGFLLCCCRRHR